MHLGFFAPDRRTDFALRRVFAYLSHVISTAGLGGESTCCSVTVADLMQYKALSDSLVATVDLYSFSS